MIDRFRMKWWRFWFRRKLSPKGRESFDESNKQLDVWRKHWNERSG